MPKFVNTSFLITQKRIYTKDVALTGISNTLGKITIIIKNGGSPNSRRFSLLNKGTVIKCTLYLKNHYYLSEFEIIENFVPKVKSYFALQILSIVFNAITSHYLDNSQKLYNRIIQLLNKFTEANDATAFAIGFAIFNALGLLNTVQLRCTACDTSIIQGGVFFEGQLFCKKCAPPNFAFEFKLLTQATQLELFKNILKYWEM